MILEYLNMQDKESTQLIFWLLLKEIKNIIYVLHYVSISRLLRGSLYDPGMEYCNRCYSSFRTKKRFK